jgi:hypothetical protein
VGTVFDVDAMGLLAREVLRERAAALIAETCAWAVGLSDQPHQVLRRGSRVPSGLTLGQRAATDQPLGEEDGRIDLGEARPGSFQDALNALTPDGGLYADRYDEQVLEPFVLDVCVRAAERVRDTRRGAWTELLDELGESEEDADLAEVVRAGEWEAPLRIEAEHLVLAALRDVPLIEVEAEGLPLSLVRAAEAVVRTAAAPPTPEPEDQDLAGSLFLAQAAVDATGVPQPVPPDAAELLLTELLAHGLEPDEVPAVLPHLAVQPATVDEVLAIIRAADIG